MGAGAVTAGCWLVSVALGLLVLGLFLLALGVLLTLRDAVKLRKNGGF